ARWFDGRRGLALAVVLVGFNLGYISGGPLAAWLIRAIGWRAAYAVLGGGSCVLGTLAALTVRLPAGRDQPARAHDARAASGAVAPVAGNGVTLATALGDGHLWCLNASWLLLGALAMMVSVHIVPFARDHAIDLAAASFTLTAYGLGSVVGRLASGAVSDRLGTVATLRAAYVVQALALTALLLASSRQTLF